ncbi:MAG: SPASM domain-containing protein, partial [Muribaculaceae bacterium]|nr:SPASM domain-containing protein [Muribaculaceae bacterium]
CDNFVRPEYRLGNILEQPLQELLYGERQLRFGRSKKSSLPRECLECRWLFACHGECPKNRITTDCYGEPGLNCLCSGYRQFFAHVAADMDFMKSELAAGRPPSNICHIKRSENSSQKNQ